VTKDVSFNMFNHVEQMYTRKNTGMSENLTNPQLRKDMQMQLSMQMNVNEHKVLRIANNDPKESNSVYVSFFKFGLLGRKEYLFLKVLVHYLKDKVFNKLRNELNLGYVASAFLVDYHYTSGVVIMVEGETFRPTGIEQIVDAMMLEFIDEMRILSEDEYDKLCAMMVRESTTLPTSLASVTSRLYSDKRFEETMGDQISYQNVLKFNKIAEFRTFVSKYLLQDSSRLTIQMFAEEVRTEEQNFIMEANLALNRRAYDVVTLDQIRAMKSK